MSMTESRLAQTMQAQIEAYLHDLQHQRARAQNTLLAYRADLVQFSRYVQARALNEGNDAPTFADSDAQAWREVLVAHGYAPATVERKIAAVASFAAWSRAAGWAAPRMAEVEEKAQPDIMSDDVMSEPVSPVVSPEQVAALLEKVLEDGSAQGLRDHAMLQLMCALGVRVGELAALNVADYFAQKGRIAIGGGKRRRVAEMPATVAEALATYVTESRPHFLVDLEEGALFLNHRGKRLTRQGIWLIVVRHAAAAGLEGEITPQSLRRAWLQGEIMRGLGEKEYAGRAGTSAKRSARDYRRAAKQLPQTPTIFVDGKPYMTDTR